MPIRQTAARDADPTGVYAASSRADRRRLQRGRSSVIALGLRRVDRDHARLRAARRAPRRRLRARRDGRRETEEGDRELRLVADRFYETMPAEIQAGGCNFLEPGGIAAWAAQAQQRLLALAPARPVGSGGCSIRPLQGLRRPRDLPRRARRGGRLCDRARLRRAVRAAAGRGRARHAALLAGDGRGGDRAASPTAAPTSPTSAWSGPRCVYFATGELGLDGGIMVTASHNPKQYTGMKIVAAGRAAGRQRVGPDRGPRPGAGGGLARRRRAASVETGRRLGRVRRPGARVRRPGRDRARCGSSSTRRTGWPARCCRACSTGCPRSRSCAATSSPTARSPTTSPTRSCPRTASSSSGETLEEERRLRGRLRRRRRPLLLRRRPRRVRPRRLHDRALCRVDARARAGRQGDLRRPRLVGGARGDRARRRRAADQPRRPLVHQAADARGRRRLRRRGLGPLLLPRLLAGRLGRRSPSC